MKCRREFSTATVFSGNSIFPPLGVDKYGPPPLGLSLVSESRQCGLMKPPKKKAVPPISHEKQHKELVRYDAPPDPSKRAAMQLFLSFATGVASSYVANKLSDPDHSNSKLVGPSYLEPTADVMLRGRDYSYLGYHLFLSSLATEIAFRAPRNWKRTDGSYHPPDTRLPDGQMTYGHEACVFRAISTFLHKELGVNWENMASLPEVGTDNSRVLLGSGASNAETEEILGRPEAPRFGTPACTLYYGIGQELEALRRWQYGGFVTPNVHTICDRDGKTLLRPESRGGDQIDDYLLVTRMPGPQPGTALTIFAGLHGPGTRSAERIFSSLSLKDMTDLASIINLQRREIPYFQAIFRASEFRRNPSDDPTDSDVANELELVTTICPPRRLDV